MKHNVLNLCLIKYFNGNLPFSRVNACIMETLALIDVIDYLMVD